MPRAAVRKITGSSGFKPPPDVIDFQVDQRSVHVGEAVTGTISLVEYQHRKKSPTVHLVFEGLEYTVVAFPPSEDNCMGIDYLKEHTTEKNAFLHLETTLEDCGQKAQPFHFVVPDDLPSTLRCVLDGTDPMLPSQCQIKYTMTASIYNALEDGGGKMQVSYPLIVYPKKEIPENTPLDPSISVSVENSMNLLFGNLFSCGTECSSSSADEPILLDVPSYVTDLNLIAGQSLEVKIQDWMMQLRNKGNWMVKFTEEITWKAKGRTAHSLQSWDLFANHHELPSSLRKSHQTPLITVQHKLAVYLASKELSREVLATTENIPVRILSSNRGWDA